METKIDTEEYNGFTIETHIDDISSPMDMLDCIGQLHCDSRDLYIGAVRKDGKDVQKPITLNCSIYEMIDIMKDNAVYTGDYGSHSGVWLTGSPDRLYPEHLMDGVRKLMANDRKDYEETEEDAIREITCREAMEADGNDNATDSVLLILPHDITGKDEKEQDRIAKDSWKTWDDIVRGNVYGFIIKDKDGDRLDDIECEGSCWGFVGDDDLKEGITSARATIDHIDQKAYYSKKYAEQVKEAQDRLASVK